MKLVIEKDTTVYKYHIQKNKLRESTPLVAHLQAKNRAAFSRDCCEVPWVAPHTETGITPAFRTYA